MVSVSDSGLTGGTYQGSITVNGGGATVIPVTFNISTTAGIVATPTSITFSQTVGGTAPSAQTVQLVDSTATNFTASASGASWLNLSAASGTTPATLTLTPNTSGLGVGTYQTSVTILSMNAASLAVAAVFVPVTLTIASPNTSGAVPATQLILNYASQQSGPIAPGEIVEITGSNLGPATAAGPQIVSGVVSTNDGGTEVLFDGILSPVLYTSASQLQVAVPYEVYGRVSTNVVVSFGGVLSTAIDMQVSDTAPGVFTADGSGQGQAAIINPGGTANSSSSPAARGSTVSIYATGEGQTTPPGQDGLIIGSNLRNPIASVTVMIGGQQATVVYVGSAAQQVSGMLQINAVVPANVVPGNSVPVEIFIGGIPSQLGVTMAVD
jgi:uncharacterized protein (TIGR03437 family)